MILSILDIKISSVFILGQIRVLKTHHSFRKTRPFITERLLMGRKESNQTKTNSFIFKEDIRRPYRLFWQFRLHLRAKKCDSICTQSKKLKEDIQGPELQCLLKVKEDLSSVVILHHAILNAK